MNTVDNNAKNENQLTGQLENASGAIRYSMLNDYMFRVVMQKSIPALKKIISAVLHRSADSIGDIVINNTVIPGEAIEDKEYRMDISMTIDNSTRVNIELQVCDLKNWTCRSLHYLCREYERCLKKGHKYENDHAAYQIGFLDYTLFDDHVKFFSSFEMCDVDDYYKYNSNFALFVIDLTQIDKATEADKASELDKWCRLFKAKTWDELKNIVKEDRIMAETAEAIYIYNSDEIIQKRCQDREEYLAEKNWYEEQLKKKDSEIAILREKLKSLGVEP